MCGIQRGEGLVSGSTYRARFAGSGQFPISASVVVGHFHRCSRVGALHHQEAESLVVDSDLRSLRRLHVSHPRPAIEIRRHLRWLARGPSAGQCIWRNISRGTEAASAPTRSVRKRSCGHFCVLRDVSRLYGLPGLEFRPGSKESSDVTLSDGYLPKADVRRV